jgi:beta-1,4-mannosyl-glycoprotein beta-1,4-N-acetylglucosaminyltransferase
VVDRFVVIQATHTFSGIKRQVPPLTHPKVLLVEPDEVFQNPWDTEAAHRNAGLRGLVGLVNNDVVLVSDVDEIPDRDLIPRFAAALHRHPVLTLEQKFYYYNFNWRKPTMWRNAYVTTFGQLRSVSMQNLRRSGHPIVPDAGWHMSYADSAEKIREKIESFSHQELNTPRFKAEDHLRGCLTSGTDLFLRGPTEDCIWTEAAELPEELQAFNTMIKEKQTA